MKNYILIILFVCVNLKVVAQYPSEISFEINQQKFLVKVNYTNENKPVIVFYRGSLQIKTDTLFHNEFSKLYFRGFSKDTLLNIRLIEYKIGGKDGTYTYTSKYEENEKMLSLDIDNSVGDKYCKLYEYNKKHNTFISVNGFDWISNPQILKSNPYYFTSTQTFDCENFSYITTLYFIRNLKTCAKAQLIKCTANNSFKSMVVELYAIDKKNENQKTMIDRQSTCTMQPVCTGSIHENHFCDGNYLEKHFGDFKTYKLLGDNWTKKQIIK